MSKAHRKTRTASQNAGGFTLLELLLYVSIAAFILLSITMFVAGLLEARVKNEAIAEVEQQGVQVLQQITQSVRNSETILTPPSP